MPRLTIPVCYLVFLLFATGYALLTPPGQAPDEMPHLQFIDYLAHTPGIPDRRTDNIYQDHHPPLYHATGALALRAAKTIDFTRTVAVPGPYDIAIDLGAPALDRGAVEAAGAAVPPALRAELEAKANLRPRHFEIERGQFLLVRLLSVLLAVGTLALVHATARLLLSDAGAVSLAVGFAALLPQFQFLGAVINCDIMAVFTGNLVLWLVTRALVHGTIAEARTAVGIGLGLGAALLSKMSGIAMVVPVGAAFVLTARLTGVGRTARQVAIAFGVAALVGGWWYALNFVRYGDPFMVDVQAQTMGEQIHQPPHNAHFFAAYFYGTIQSFFGNVGPYRVPLADWAFYVYLGLTGLFLAGLLRMRTEPKDAASAHPIGDDTAPVANRGVALWVLAIGLFATWAVVFRGNLTFYSFQGRYLFPALSSIAVFAGLGWTEAIRPGGLARLAFFAFFLGSAVHLFAFRFVPYYYARRDARAGALVERYDDPGHPEGAPHLVAGSPHEAWGAFGGRRDPSLTTARGAPVSFVYTGLPLGEPLSIRVQFGGRFAEDPPHHYFVQRVRVDGAIVAPALMVAPRMRTVRLPAVSVPASSRLELAIEPVPGLAPFATVAQVWVERTALRPTGLVVPAEWTRGRPVRFEARIENRGERPVGGAIGLDYGTPGARRALGPAVRFDAIAPGETATITGTFAPPADGPTEGTFRARLHPDGADPIVDINPCISNASVGKIEAREGAFGGFAVIAADDGALRTDLPLALPTPGPWTLVVHARRSTGGTLEAIVTDGERIVQRGTLASGTTTVSIEAWPVGTGALQLIGKGEVAIDRITVSPAPGNDLGAIAFPHEPVCRIR